MHPITKQPNSHSDRFGPSHIKIPTRAYPRTAADLRSMTSAPRASPSPSETNTLKRIVNNASKKLPTYVVPTGRVVVPTGRYVVPVGKVIIIISPGRLSLVPTGRILSPSRVK
ncbi:hypothetical protein Tco_1315805 [Tanacetum coccineum]